jgi:signal transduction histidine kinase
VPISILLIEDNLGDARLFEEMLKEANIELEHKLKLQHRTNLDQDIPQMITQEEIDIVFLDLGLPGSANEETIIKFRDLEPDIPMVAYTGLNDITIGTKLLHIGADDYISKFDATPSLIVKTIWLTLERAKLRSELQEKEKMLMVQSRNAAMGDMISMIAHQWKQPLAVLSMISNNMKVDIQFDECDKEVFLKYSDDLMVQIQHLSDTIDDFRDFFVPDKPKKITTIENTIDETLKIIGKSLENNDIQIIQKHQYINKFSFPSKELVQVLINLLKNAKEVLVPLKQEEKTIILTTYAKDNCAVIEVEDNGGGVPKELLDKIFEPYFTTKGKLNGTGLGLYISKTIIEDHFAGKLTVQNSNSGAKFTIMFPMEAL